VDSTVWLSPVLRLCTCIVICNIQLDGSSVAYVTIWMYNKWTNEWMNEWMNKWMNKLTNEWMNEKMNE
jgi:hypothetical protein